MGNFIIDKFKKLFQNPAPLAPVAEGKAFCMMPWVHLHVTQTGMVAPCCQAPWDPELTFGDINHQPLAEIWNDQPIRDFRLKMLANKPDSRCARCYSKESVGLLSMRQITNKAYAHKMDWVESTDAKGNAPDSNPIYLDLRFSNLCNFRCRICGPWSSSRWHDDGVAMGMTSESAPRVTKGIEDFEGLMTQLSPFFSELEEIYFAGGEPLIMEEHYRFLDLLLLHGRTDVTLRYNTNFSQFAYKDRDVFSLWRKFKKVLICASLDDSGPRAELQRKDQVWATVLPNLQKIRTACPNAHFIITPTVSVFNVWHLPDFHKEWVASGEIEAHECFPSMLEQPEIYNIRILPLALKQQIKVRYDAHAEWLLTQGSTDDFALEMCIKEYGHCIDYMLSQDWSEKYLAEFVSTTQKLDALRGENTAAVFPELLSVLSPTGAPLG